MSTVHLVTVAGAALAVGAPALALASRRATRDRCPSTCPWSPSLACEVTGPHTEHRHIERRHHGCTVQVVVWYDPDDRPGDDGQFARWIADRRTHTTTTTEEIP